MRPHLQIYTSMFMEYIDLVRMSMTIFINYLLKDGSFPNCSFKMAHLTSESKKTNFGRNILKLIDLCLIIKFKIHG